MTIRERKIFDAYARRMAPDGSRLRKVSETRIPGIPGRWIDYLFVGKRRSQCVVSVHSEAQGI